jgi:lysozyme family protein
VAEDFLMAASNWQAVARLVLQHEGGYVDHPKDPGGATNYGITIQTYSAMLGRKATKDQVRAMKRDEAVHIYKVQYWDSVKGDDLPAGLDYAVFDFCVNSGPDRAVRDLQKVLGTVAVDGVMGFHTIAACETYGVQKLIRAYCDHRLKFMKSLSTWSTFGKGWERRVNEVRANAARMASAGKTPLIDGGAINEGQIDKANPSDKKLTSSGRAMAAGSSAVGLVGTQASDMAEKLSPYTDTMVIVKYAFIALTFVGLAVTAYMAFNAVKRGQD